MSFADGAYVFAMAANNGGPGSCMRGVDRALRARIAPGCGLQRPAAGQFGHPHRFDEPGRGEGPPPGGLGGEPGALQHSLGTEFT